MSFQTCMTFFLLWNTVSTMKMDVDQELTSSKKDNKHTIRINIQSLLKPYDSFVEQTEM